MAFQTPMYCQLCDENRTIQWKCLTCTMFLCVKCRKIHDRVITSIQHKIIDKDDLIIYGRQTTPNLSNIRCKIHLGKIGHSFCKTCAKVVCDKCIKKDHKTKGSHKHDVTSITEGYSYCVRQIQTINEQLDRNFKTLGIGMSKLDSIRSAEKQTYEKEKQKILQIEKDMIQSVKIQTKQFLSEFDLQWNILNASFKQEESKAERDCEALRLRNEQFNKAINSLDENEVFRIIEEEKNLTRHDPREIQTSFRKLPHFFPREIPSSNLTYGYFTESETGYNSNLTGSHVTKTYTTSVHTVDNLVCSEGSLWINNTKMKTLQNIKLNDKVKVLSTLEVSATDIAISPTGDIFLANLEGDLQIISQKKGKVPVISKFSVSLVRLIIKSVHISNYNRIFIGVREKGDPFPIKGQRQVIEMDMNGKTEMIYHHDNQKKELFSYPCKITTDKNRNIYVLDQLSDDHKGRIVILWSTGAVQGVFTGHSIINKDHPFTPSDLVTSVSNQAFVTDTNTHTLYIIDNEGKCFQFVSALDLGIECPFSLDIDNRGILFIGCKMRKDQSSAKIYAVEIQRK